MPNNYSRNTRQYPDKIERNHLCPLCGAYVMPFLGVLGTEHKGHCPKCGTVTYVSMPETVTHEFTSYVRAELEQEKHKALKIVLDVTRPTYDELIRGAKFTDEHRAELHKEWNEKYSDAEVQKRLNVTP